MFIGIDGTSGFAHYFTHAGALQDYLPAFFGTPAALTSDLVNGTTSPAGVFGGDLAALTLNVDFSDTSLLLGSSGVPFGDLTMCGLATPSGLNGQMVRDFLGIANTAIAGGTTAFTFAELDQLTRDLNQSFSLGYVSTFADEHLVNGPCPP
jgi:hypothetical protein